MDEQFYDITIENEIVVEDAGELVDVPLNSLQISTPESMSSSMSSEASPTPEYGDLDTFLETIANELGSIEPTEEQLNKANTDLIQNWQALQVFSGFLIYVEVGLVNYIIRV